MFVSATTPLPNISHPTSPSSHTCREASSAGGDLDERPQERLEDRPGSFHRPHFIPKEYAAISQLYASRLTTSNNYNVHPVSRPSLPPSSEVSGRDFAGDQYMGLPSKRLPACLSRHSTPATLSDRPAASDSLSPLNGLGLDFGPFNTAVDVNDTTSTKSVSMDPRGQSTTDEHASGALNDTFVTSGPDTVLSTDDGRPTTLAPSHSDILRARIDMSALGQEHLLSALLQRVDIKDGAQTSGSLAVQCTSEDRLRPDPNCQTLPLPHPEQLSHASKNYVASSPTGAWSSAAPSFAPPRSWSHKAAVEVPSGSLETTLSKDDLVSKDISGNIQNAFIGHGHIASPSSTPHRHQHPNPPSNSVHSTAHWHVNNSDSHRHWTPSFLARAASVWMLRQEALSPLQMQTAAPCHSHAAQTYPHLPQAVPVDIPLAVTQDVYTSLLTNDAKRGFSSPPSSSTDSTPSSSQELFAISSSSLRGQDTFSGASSVEVQCKQRKESLYKTELCRGYEEKGHCDYGVKCQFAHGKQELRNIQRHPKWKTELCRTFWRYGTCPYAKRCCFIHEAKEAHGASGFSGADAPAMKAPLFARVRAGPSSSNVNQSPSTGGIIATPYPQEANYQLISSAEALHRGGEPDTTRESRTRAAFQYDPFLDSVRAQGSAPAH